MAYVPDNPLHTDQQYRDYVIEKIQRGRADVIAGRTYTNREACQRLEKWMVEDVHRDAENMR